MRPGSWSTATVWSASGGPGRHCRLSSAGWGRSWPGFGPRSPRLRSEVEQLRARLPVSSHKQAAETAADAETDAESRQRDWLAVAAEYAQPAEPQHHAGQEDARGNLVMHADASLSVIPATETPSGDQDGRRPAQRRAPRAAPVGPCTDRGRPHRVHRSRLDACPTQRWNGAMSVELMASSVSAAPWLQPADASAGQILAIGRGAKLPGLTWSSMTLTARCTSGTAPRSLSASALSVLST